MNKNNKVPILCPSVPLNWEPLKGRTCIFCIFYQVQNSHCASQARMFLLLCTPLLCQVSSLSPADIGSPPAWKVRLPPPHYNHSRVWKPLHHSSGLSKVIVSLRKTSGFPPHQVQGPPWMSHSTSHSGYISTCDSAGSVGKERDQLQY